MHSNFMPVTGDICSIFICVFFGLIPNNTCSISLRFRYHGNFSLDSPPPHTHTHLPVWGTTNAAKILCRPTCARLAYSNSIVSTRKLKTELTDCFLMEHWLWGLLTVRIKFHEIRTCRVYIPVIDCCRTAEKLYSVAWNRAWV